MADSPKEFAQLTHQWLKVGARIRSIECFLVSFASPGSRPLSAVRRAVFVVCSSRRLRHLLASHRVAAWLSSRRPAPDCLAFSLSPVLAGVCSPSQHVALPSLMCPSCLTSARFNFLLSGRADGAARRAARPAQMRRHAARAALRAQLPALSIRSEPLL
jgi:hypothetical protein